LRPLTKVALGRQIVDGLPTYTAKTEIEMFDRKELIAEYEKNGFAVLRNVRTSSSTKRRPTSRG
jgi:hypothetical protein